MSTTDPRRLFAWIGDHPIVVAVAVALLTVPALILAMQRSDEEPDFGPSGGIFALDELIEERFDTTEPVWGEIFISEARSGDVLTAEALGEIHRNTRLLRADPELSEPLTTEVDHDLGITIDGLWSIADEVDARLDVGLDGATDGDIDRIVSELLADGAPTASFRNSLATDASRDGGRWQASALLTELRYDRDAFGVDDVDVEAWLRDVQEVLQGDEVAVETLGLVIDGDLAEEERLAQSIPFLLAAVVMIVLVVGVVLRSYWAAAVVALGLGLTMVWFNAVLSLLDRKGGLLLAFVVPISVISFGVDFFVHAMGRVREAQREGIPGRLAYARGLTLVSAALLVAVTSSAAAFLANTGAGIEAIVDFGIGTATALAVAFVLLGIVGPRMVIAMEDHLGTRPRPRPWHRALHATMLVMMATLFGVAVSLAATAPNGLLRVVAMALMIVVSLLFVALALRVVGRSYRRRLAAGHHAVPPTEVNGDGLRAAGSIVHAFARHRRITLPAAALVGIGGLVLAVQVESGAELRDFVPADTDMVRSIESLERNFGEATGRTSQLYVEGDLTDPDVLLALDAAVDTVDRELPGDAVARDSAGLVQRDHDGVELARLAVAERTAADFVERTTGIAVADTDGDGLPDTADQVAAVFAVARQHGLPGEDGELLSAADVQSFLWIDGTEQATLLSVPIPTDRGGAAIGAAEDAWLVARDELRTGPVAADLTRVDVAGEAIVDRHGMRAYTDAMLLSLPVALVLCIVVAALCMRSVRFGVVAVVPIVGVVVLLYAFMALTGVRVNPITSTLAAIAVGIGIDYAIHFTMRFREEAAPPGTDRLDAIRRAGEGTGGALIVSAATSMIGFTVLGLAPFPAFATFGRLTAVMIGLSLAVALLVLPSLLLLASGAPDPSAPDGEPSAASRALAGAGLRS